MICIINPTRRDDLKVGTRVKYNNRLGTIVANDFWNFMPETKLDNAPKNEIALIPWQKLEIIVENKDLLSKN